LGCDIHILTEIKFKGQPWQLWLKNQNPGDRGDTIPHSEHEIDCISARSYDFFGTLAGVRSFSRKAPIAEHRGIPKDACKETTEWAKESGYHSWTYCSIKEMDRAINRYRKNAIKEGIDDGDFGLVSSVIDIIQFEQKCQDILPVFFNTYGYSDYDHRLTVFPIKRMYEILCAEQELLALPKPRVRFIIGFDS
jgi:hypothetical protein